MVTWLATETNNIQKIINLLTKCPVYKMDKEGDSQTLRNEVIFKSTPKAAVKDNRYRIFVYLNINNLHFKHPLKPEIIEDIS